MGILVMGYKDGQMTGSYWGHGASQVIAVFPAAIAWHNLGM